MSDNKHVQFADRHFLSMNIFKGQVWIHLSNWNSRSERKSISMKAEVFSQLLSEREGYLKDIQDLELSIPLDTDMAPLPVIPPHNVAATAEGRSAMTDVPTTSYNTAAAAAGTSAMSSVPLPTTLVEQGRFYPTSSGRTNPAARSIDRPTPYEGRKLIFATLTDLELPTITVFPLNLCLEISKNFLKFQNSYGSIC